MKQSNFNARTGNPGKRPLPPPPIENKSSLSNIDNTNYRARIKQKIDYLNKHIDNYYKSDCVTAICRELEGERDALEYLLSDLIIKDLMIESMLNKISMTKFVPRVSTDEYANGQVYMTKDEMREYFYKLASSMKTNLERRL